MGVRIIRNMSTPEARAFWGECEKNHEEIKDWPGWKRAGINVSQMREGEAVTEPISDEDLAELRGNRGVE